MRLILLFVGAVFYGMIANPSAGRAEGSAWCAHYGNELGGTNCGFVSFDQCMAALSGNGGYCGQNAQYHSPPSHPVSRRYQRSN
jgi:hypothetical protein